MIAIFYCFDCAMLPTITSFYSVTRNTLWQLAEKTHILIFISDGCCRVSLDGADFLLKKGDICFIPADHSYTRRSVDGTFCTMTYIHFTLPSPVVEEEAPVLAKKLTQRKQELETRVLEGEQNPDSPTLVYLQPKTSSHQYGDELSTLFDRVLHASTNRHLMHNLTLSVDLCRILLLLSRETVNQLLSDDTIQNPTLVPRNLKRVIEYIIANYSKPITLDDLACVCHVSKQQVIRYFRVSLNTTPIQYINNYRLSQARELLFRQTHLTIKEIAVELGFENPHYFTRLFTATYGETPTQYRARIKNYNM